MKKTCFWTSYRHDFDFCLFRKPQNNPPNFKSTMCDIWHRRVPLKITKYGIFYFSLEDIGGEMIKNVLFTSVTNAYVSGKSSIAEVNSRICVLLRVKTWVSNLSKFEENCDVWLMFLADTKILTAQNHRFIVIAKDMWFTESPKTTYYVWKSHGSGNQVSH